MREDRLSRAVCQRIVETVEAGNDGETEKERGSRFDVREPLFLNYGGCYSRTYSNSNGLPLMPVAGGAIQLAILPGSVTGFMRLCT